MACEVKARLTMEFERILQAYSVAVREMAMNVGTTPKGRYLELHRASEDLRLQYERARFDLERHTATHNC
jgi:hypothetical protein